MKKYCVLINEERARREVERMISDDEDWKEVKATAGADDLAETHTSGKDGI
ncbi:MAG: hypothetical protein HFI46_12500 [Lachnospiraceae bacterium]|mgnify:CR=1 FL=1|nr:hypothetical protein [Lachnospiraceae bacterium]